MIEQRLMAYGRFSGQLRPNAPVSKRHAIREFDHIVITPVRMNPAETSNTIILGAAAYVGVITHCDSKTGSFSGVDLSHWLGTADGLGALITTPIALTAGTLTAWITALLPSSITLGTITNTTTLTNSYVNVTPREAIVDVCRLLGAEWRINPNFTLDAGPVANLFVTTPTVVVTDREEGQDGSYRGLDGSLSQTVDVTKYATDVICVPQGSGATVETATASSGATTYRDGLGNVVVMKALINAPTTPATSSSAAATAALAQLSAPARQVSVTSKTYAVTRFAKPGDSVYAYDLEAQLLDITKAITYRGEMITPIAERVLAINWPVAPGMSVFVRRSTGVGTFTYTDLTDSFAFETGDVTWEVGAINPAIAPDITQIASPATLGNNPAVADRTTIQPMFRLDTTAIPSAPTVPVGASTVDLNDPADGSVYILPTGWTISGSLLEVPDGLYAISWNWQTWDPYSGDTWVNYADATYTDSSHLVGFYMAAPRVGQGSSMGSGCAVVPLYAKTGGASASIAFNVYNGDAVTHELGSVITVTKLG